MPGLGLLPLSLSFVPETWSEEFNFVAETEYPRHTGTTSMNCREK